MGICVLCKQLLHWLNWDELKSQNHVLVQQAVEGLGWLASYTFKVQKEIVCDCIDW